MPSFPFVYSNALNVTTLAASGNSAAVSLPPRSANMAVVAHCKVTIGTSTGIVVKLQALNPDGSTWEDVQGQTSASLTASANLALSAVLAGVKQVRVAYTAAGTTTTSGLVVDFTVQQ